MNPASSPARGQLTPEQVRDDPFWGPLLRTHIPGWDPLRQAAGCTFDADEALRVLEFFPRFLRHAKPPVQGKPFELRDWQSSILANLLGWRQPDGRRRFRRLFLYVGKKNTKTELMAGLALYLMSSAPMGAEFFVAAAAQEQAGEMHTHACGMIQQHQALRTRFVPYGEGPRSVRRAIAWPARRVSLKVLQSDADTVDSVGPYFVLIDELHRHADSALMDVLLGGQASQQEPLAVITTTADYNRESPCNEMLERARQVRDCVDPKDPHWAPSFLPAIWEAGKDDDWADPATWAKANPNLGVSVSMEFMRDLVADAKTSPTKLAALLRLHLNVVTDADVTEFAREEWDRCGGVRLGAGRRASWIQDLGLAGRRCYLGMDLGKTTDLTALAAVFPPELDGELWHALVWSWMPRERMAQAERRDRVPYTTWALDGWIQPVEGNVMDYRAVREQVKRVHEACSVVRLGYDSWNATETALEIQDHGVECVEVRQGPRSYSEACLKVRELVTAGRLAHAGNPVLRSNAMNVVFRRDENANLAPSKKRSKGRIDLFTAMLMGLALAILDKTEPEGALDAAYVAGEGIYLG